MGNVIQMQRRQPRADVVAHYERQLARAKSGEIQGGMDVVSLASSNDASSIFGAFAEDLEYAHRAANAGFSCLCGHMAAAGSPNQLPLRLRKGYQSEDVEILPLSVRCL